MSDAPLIELIDVRRVFRRAPTAGESLRALLGRPPAPAVAAVDGVSLAVRPGDRIGIVGSSGGGKSTLGRLMGGILLPTTGVVRWRGQDVAALSPRARHAWRKAHIQVLTQNQYGALNPRLRAREAVEESLRAHRPELTGAARDAEALALLSRAGIASCAERYVPALSGGERRRVTLACLIAASPTVLILDEPVAGLDPVLRNDAVRLIEALLEARPETALVLISHELDVIDRLCNHVHVIAAGKVMESFDTGEPPQHPHTQALVASHEAAALPSSLRAKYVREDGAEEGVAVMEYITILGTASIFFGTVIFALGESMHSYLDFAFWWLSVPAF